MFFIRWPTRLVAIGLFGLTFVAAACGGDSDPAPLTAAQLCAAVAAPDVTVDAGDVLEASGIAASRRNENVLWLHNDSGDEARFFAIDSETGEQLAEYSLAGATAIDWEDMAIGRGPEEGIDYLYLADIGDNEAVRPEVTVYRVPEPEVDAGADVTSSELTDFDALVLHYPDRPHDAETFMVDPLDGGLVIVTKELSNNVSKVFHATADASVDAPTTLTDIVEVDFAALSLAAPPGPDAPVLPRALPLVPTGGEVSPDGRLVAVRTYGGVFVWDRPDGSKLDQAFVSQPCEAPSSLEQQGEAIALDPDGRGYTTVSEGSSPPLHHFVVQ